MRPAATVAILLSVLTVGFGIAYPFMFATSTPTNDIIDFYYWYLGSGGLSGFGFDKFYAWHNEHRLVVPRMWFIADILLVEGRQTFLLVVIFLSAFLHAGLLAALFRGLGQSRDATALAFVIAAAAAVSPVQFENLLQGFQVQFVQVWLFASTALALIAWAPVAEGRWLGPWVIAALVAGLLSTYSMFNGLAVWPLLVVFAMWRRFPLGWIFAVATVGSTIMAVEVYGFLNRPGGGVTLPEGTSVWTFVRYMARYLTSGISEIGTLGQEIVGVAAVLGVIGGGLRTLFRPSDAPPERMALYGICAFILSAAFVTALGRLQFGLGSAEASRYTTPSMVFLFVAGMLAIDALSRRSATRALPWVTGLLTVLLLVPGLVKGAREIPFRLIERDLADQAIASDLAGGYRPDTIAGIYPHWPPFPAQTLAMLRSNGLGPYSELKRFVPPADALAQGPAVGAPECFGNADRLEVDVVNGVTFSAWLIDPSTGRRPTWAVGRAPDGRAVAWGMALEPRGDMVTIPADQPFDRGYRAFGEVPNPPVQSITVEGVFEDGSRCRLPGTISPRPARFLQELPAGAQRATEQQWSFIGTPPFGRKGEVQPPSGIRPVYGTFGQKDRRFDAWIELGDPGEAKGVALPILTDRWPFGTTIEILGADGVPVDRVDLKRPSERAWVWATLRPQVMTPGMRLAIRTVQAHAQNNVAFGTPFWLP